MMFISCFINLAMNVPVRSVELTEIKKWGYHKLFRQNYVMFSGNVYLTGVDVLGPIDLSKCFVHYWMTDGVHRIAVGNHFSYRCAKETDPITLILDLELKHENQERIINELKGEVEELNCKLGHAMSYYNTIS